MSQPLELVIRARRDASLQSNLNAAAAQVRKFHQNVEQDAGKGVRANARLSASFKQVGASISPLPIGMTAVAGAAIGVGAAFVGAVKMAAEFDKQMRNVNSLLHLAPAGFEALSKQVVGLSTVIPKTASDLAEGLYGIASSGYTGAEGVGILNKAAIAATAGLTSTETAATSITGVLHAYGQSANEAGDVSDILFQTVNKGVISFDELASGIGNIVGISSAAGVSFDQVGSAIATLTLSGQTGSTAMTNLQNLLTKMLRPGEALKAAFKGLGYESGEAALRANGLRGTIDLLAKSTDGSATSWLHLFPDIQAANGALGLAANNGKNYASVAKDIENVNARAGSTQATFNEQMKSASAQFELAKNKAAAIGIELGGKLLPVLVALLGGFGDMLDVAVPALSALANNAKAAVSPVVALGQAVSGPLAAGFDKVSVVGGPALHGIGVGAQFALHNVIPLAAAMGGYLLVSSLAAAGGLRNVVWQLYAVARANAAAAMTRFGGSLALIASPAGLAAVAVGVTTAALIHNYQSTQKARKEAREFASTVDSLMIGLSKDVTPQGMRKVRHELGEATTSAKKLGYEYQNSSTLFKMFNKEASITVDKDLDKAANAWIEYNKKTTSANENVKILAKSFGIGEQSVRKFAAANNIDLTGGIVASSNAMATALEKNAKAAPVVTAHIKNVSSAALGAQLNTASYAAAMSTLADDTADASDRLDAFDTALKLLTGGLNLNEATRAASKAVRDLGDDFEELHKAKIAPGLSLTTKAGAAYSSIIDEAAKATFDLVSVQEKQGVNGKVIVSTYEAQRKAIREAAIATGLNAGEVDKYLASIGLVPKTVTTLVTASTSSADAALTATTNKANSVPTLRTITVQVTSSGIEKVVRDIANINGRNVVVGVTYGGSGPGAKRAEAHGDVLIESYANGGTRLPRNAMIAKDGDNLIQWAERGTGGEAFIPLAKDRRGRSEDLLATVADLFGYELHSYANGGYVKDAVGKASSSKTANKAKETAAKKVAKTASVNAETVREIARLMQPVALEVSFNLSGAVSALQGQAETQARNAAEVRAKRTANDSDTADDYYRRPNLRLKDYAASFKKQAQAAGQWGKDLSRISRIAGRDVADQLEAMGEAGRDLTHKLATGSAADVRRVVAELRKLGPSTASALAQYRKELDRGTADTASFGRDLLTLIGRGQAGLAAKLAEMGVESGGAIAAGAARANNATLAGVGKSVAANSALSDPTFIDALKLAGILSSGGGKVGIQGLADRSGSNVSDVIGLITRYSGQVFAKLGKAMTTVNIDLERIKGGQGLTGMRHGGILPDGANAVNFAERGTGGEAYIPLGAQNRARSVDLWKRTGRALGVEQRPSSSSPSVVVSPGAVSMKVVVPPGMTEAAATRIAERVTDKAMVSLAREIRTGYR